MLTVIEIKVIKALANWGDLPDFFELVDTVVDLIEPKVTDFPPEVVQNILTEALNNKNFKGEGKKKQK